jgi:hypothetical protein
MDADKRRRPWRGKVAQLEDDHFLLFPVAHSTKSQNAKLSVGGREGRIRDGLDPGGNC